MAQEFSTEPIQQAYNFIVIRGVCVERVGRTAHEERRNANVHASRNACESSKLSDLNTRLK